MTIASEHLPPLGRALTVPPPPSRRTRVIVVDDDPALRRTLVRLLENHGFTVRAMDDGAEAVRLAEAGETDVMLVDVEMPRLSGIEVLERVKRAQADVEVVMMTAFANVEIAVAAVKAGAYDFLTKPFYTSDAVAIAVSKAAERRQLLGRTRELEKEVEAHAQFGSIVGTSMPMRHVLRLANGVAASTSSILILGESGTGKEMIARGIHQRSTRGAKPWVVVNCGAIPTDLVESELFGHTRGAFTGAETARAGLFETADHGTIFLDEIGDLPMAAQVKLLRALQEGEVRRVGSNESRIVDVRVIAATNVDLRNRIREGRFREDLYYRLNVISFVLPPLRDRRDDIPLLAAHFLSKCARRMGKEVKRIAPEALAAMQAQPWPGNVRELENAIERAVVLSRSDLLTTADLGIPDATPAVPVNGAVDVGAAHTRVDHDLPYPEARKRALLAFEAEYARSMLAKTNGNISLAARAAGLDRSNFKRVLRRVQSGDADDLDQDE